MIRFHGLLQSISFLLLEMSSRMEACSFDHFEIIPKPFTLLPSSVERRIQQAASKQHPFNSNHVSSQREDIRNGRCSQRSKFFAPISLLKDVLVATLRKRPAHILEISPTAFYCNSIESSSALPACLKGNVNIIIICFVVYTRLAYGWSWTQPLKHSHTARERERVNETGRLDWHILLINRSTVDYLLFIARRKSKWTQVCVQSDFLTSANERAYASVYARWLSLVQILPVSFSRFHATSPQCAQLNEQYI